MFKKGEKLMIRDEEQRIYDFYQECALNKFLDFDDEYANFKINALARKHKLISSEETISKEDFDFAYKIYHKKLKEKLAETNKQIEDKQTDLLKQVWDINQPVITKNGKEKRAFELNNKIHELQEAVDNVDKLKKVLTESYYSGSKQSHESWFWQGLGTELATGSRALGSLAVAEVNEKNRQIDESNKQLKKQIEQKVYNDSRLDTSSAKNDIRILKNKLKELDTAFVSFNKNYCKYIGYAIDEWGVNPRTGFAHVRGKMWLKKKPQMPGNISASLDGTCKAVIYKKSDLSVLTEILLPLPIMGVGIAESNNLFGVQKGTWENDINKNEYGIELIDYNVCAIEEKESKVSKQKSDGNQEIADKLLFADIKNNLGTIEDVKKAISTAENIDSDIIGKDEFISEAKIKLDALYEKKKEDDRIAEEKRIADEKARAIQEEEDRKQAEINRKRLTKKLIIASVIIVAIGIASFVYTTTILPKNNYNKALSYYENGEYENALTYFSKTNDYEDSQKYIEASKKHISLQNIINGSFSDEDVSNIDGVLVRENLEDSYTAALKMIEMSEYNVANKIFSLCSDYKDSSKYISYCEGINAEGFKNTKKAIEYYLESGGILDASSKINALCESLIKNGNISLEDVLFVFNSCPSLQSKYRDIYDLAVDLQQYKALGKPTNTVNIQIAEDHTIQSNRIIQLI